MESLAPDFHARLSALAAKSGLDGPYVQPFLGAVERTDHLQFHRIA
jgi:hypothetical protein